jgi:hypothetical protein
VADITPSVAAAPTAFVLGVLVGFWLASFYQIIKRKPPDDD